MYNAHWIHSLPYSKFIELTLITGSTYKYPSQKSAFFANNEILYSQIYIRNVASPKAYPNQEQSRIN